MAPFQCLYGGFEPEGIKTSWVRQAAASGADRRRLETTTRRARAVARVIPLSPPIKQKAPVWGLLLYQGSGGFDEKPSVRPGAAERRRRTSALPGPRKSAAQTAESIPIFVKY